MKILAVDTSSKICSVALMDDDNLIDILELDNGRTHSENLMPLIEQIISKNNLTVKDINLIACAVGPGSFTGIRIGVASVKPIAEVLGIKLASVTSLETLAGKIDAKENEKICALIDAKNNQVYMGVFDNNYNLIGEYVSDEIDVALNELSDDHYIFVGDGSENYKELIVKKLVGKDISFSGLINQSSKEVGKIGLKKALDNNLVSADEIIPTYLKKSQAERLKK